MQGRLGSACGGYIQNMLVEVEKDKPKVVAQTALTVWLSIL